MKKLFYFLLPLLAFIGCTESGTDDNNSNNNQGGGNTEPPKTELTVNVTDLLFDADSDVKTIDIYSSDAWTAEFVNDRASEWCTISPKSGQSGNNSILVSVAENNSGEERSASVIIKAKSLQKVVKVTQKQNDALTVTSSKFEVKAEGGEVEIEVKANVDYDYSIEESAKSWVTYKTTRAMETSTLVFDIAENADTKKREAKITFKSGDLKEVVTIYQEGTEYAIIISKDEYTVSDKGATIAVEVKSNVDVAVEIPSDVDWIQEVSTRSMSTNTYYFEVLPNDGYNSRTAKIKFTNKENNLSESVTISQTQKNAIVITKSSYTVDNDGGEIDIEVGHNVDFDVEISDSWITKASTRAFETETLTFNIAANSSNDSREGTIKFTSKDKSITQTVKVYQSQSDALIVSKKNIVIDEQSQTVEFEVRANVDYTVSDPSASWLHRENTRAMTSQTIRYRVDANSDYNSRTATITVQSKDGSMKETITVTQAQKDAIVLAKSSYTVDNDGGEIDIEVGHNVDFDVEISDSWITKASTRAFETETLTFNIAANSSNDSREGTIKFTSKDKSITQTVTIEQEGYDPTKPRKNEIWYTSRDGNIVKPYSTWDFGANIVSNTYENGKGVIKFDGGITKIGNRAFYNCYHLESVTIPDSVTEIGDYAFHYCSGMAKAPIGNSVTTIGQNAFSYCHSLVTITIPDSVTEIGASAFYFCGELTILYIGDGVTTIGANAFSTCNELKRVTIGNNVKIIGFRAFEYCSKLRSVTIPDSVIEISDSAFNGCESLASVTIGDSVTTIGDYAFKGCSELTSVTIPDSVTEIGYSAFPNKLRAFYGKYASADNRCLVIDGVLNSIAGYGLTSYIIPDSVTAIEKWAFSYYGGLESIIIPDSVTKIGDYAFYNCYHLESITIPDSVTEIGERAFCACSGMKSIYCKPATPPFGYHNMFNDISASAIIYVPMASVEAYTAADGWFVYADIIVGYDF